MARQLTCPEYEHLKKTYLNGWEIWNVESVFSYVHMPDALALNLCIREYRDGTFLREALIGRFPRAGDEQENEVLYPGDHALDDAYTSMEIAWKSLRFRIETAADEDRFYLLITPIERQLRPARLFLTAGHLYNRPGRTALCQDGKRGVQYLHAVSGEETWNVFSSTRISETDVITPLMTPFLSVLADGPVGFVAIRGGHGEAAGSVNKPHHADIPADPARLLEEITEAVAQKKQALRERQQAFGENSWLHRALECAIAWDTVYDPNHDRVLSPVSRLWSIRSGGYVLFCWDNCFAAYMAAEGSKALAYSNIIEILNERTEDGFVPNLSYGTGQKSLDRSQPPVGSRMLFELYRKYHDKWIVELLYPALLEWNTWFFENRCAPSGALCWGSNPSPVLYGNRWESDGVDDRYGAALESGLDNSPMYDDIPFNKDTHLLELEDVGLTGLFIMDCRALSALAELLGKADDLARLNARREIAEEGLMALWDEENGFFYNRRTDTGRFSRRISPTNYYALFSDRVSEGQAERMLKEHYYNPEEFYGEWMLPSIARSDPAFGDQDYWRGRVWAPLNFLVYLAFEQHGLREACRDLAAKSVHILRPEWEQHRHIHENYSAVTGEGCDSRNSDKFYHWGALLACIGLREYDHGNNTQGK